MLHPSNEIVYFLSAGMFLVKKKVRVARSPMQLWWCPLAPFRFGALQVYPDRHGGAYVNEHRRYSKHVYGKSNCLLPMFAGSCVFFPAGVAAVSAFESLSTGTLSCLPVCPVIAISHGICGVCAYWGDG